MSQLTKDELDEIFIDVRKAYRLLYLFQRRTLDTIKFIADALSKNVISGYPLYSGSCPGNGSRVNLDSWAWDWLNMYVYEFYLGEEKINNDLYKFAIAIQSDTGYYDSKSEITQTAVQLFPAVEDCSTKIFFYVGRNMWKPDAFDKAWSRTAEDEFQFREGEHTLFLSKRFDLSEFMDENSILSKLKIVNDFFTSKGVSNLLTGLGV